jgi:hypothetical protein
LFLNKSLETVLGIFAILKAGGVRSDRPIGTAPAVGFIIQNCGIRCLLTKSAKLARLRSTLSEPSPVDLVLLMEENPEQALPSSTSSCAIPLRRCPGIR